MEAKPTIIEVLEDRSLLGMFINDRSTWLSWWAFYKALHALEPDPVSMDIYKRCTGRDKWPSKPALEAWLISGRRSGKSFSIALNACYEAVFVKHKLSPGEVGYVLIISPSRQQSSIVKRYLSSFFNDNPFLNSLVLRETASEIELSNSIIISVLASDFRTLRGFTCVCAILDEIAFFFSEGSRPDYEAVRALRPALATTGGSLIAISSPYSRRGSLYSAYKNHYGKDSPVLVWQSSSLQMNTTLSVDLIEQASLEDPEGSRSEWEGLFRSDLESYISREALEACVEPNVYELPYNSNYQYLAFCDSAGGSGRDSYTVAIAHLEEETRVLDLVRETRPPFSPDQTTKNYAAILKEYKCTTVVGDRFGGEYPRERFAVYGIDYKVADMPKSDYYRELLPLMNSGRVTLLDNSKLINQIVSLERRVGRGGKDYIDHPPNAHDDIANAAAGSLVSLQDYTDTEIKGYGHTLASQAGWW